MKKLAYRVVVCVAVLGWSVGCQETTTLPITPSSLPEDKVGVLALACPADQMVPSLNGVDASVDYPPPHVSGGQAPVVSSCDPVSGATHAIGTVPATCLATDDIGQTASCSFTLRVLPKRTISKVRYLAFGDSLTAGVTSAPVTPILEPSKSYPFKLEQMLSERYLTQTITVANAGLSGEFATEGVLRIGSQIDGVRPEVVLIMEGTNDLGRPMYSFPATASALDGMVAEARGRGADAIISTLPPIRFDGGKFHTAQDLTDLNASIRSIGFSRGIPQVDTFSAISQGNCVSALTSFGLEGPGGRLPFATSIPCIGSDGLHPTAQGYEVMAKAFLDVIVNTYDISMSGARASTRRPPLGTKR